MVRGGGVLLDTDDDDDAADGRTTKATNHVLSDRWNSMENCIGSLILARHALPFSGHVLFLSFCLPSPFSPPHHHPTPISPVMFDITSIIAVLVGSLGVFVLFRYWFSGAASGSVPPSTSIASEATDAILSQTYRPFPLIEKQIVKYVSMRHQPYAMPSLLSLSLALSLA
jgi:hypothetical protein